MLVNAKEKLKSTLAFTAYSQLRSWLDANKIRFVAPIVKLFSSTGFTSSLYYFLFNRRFDLEHQAALQARLEFLAQQRFPTSGSNALLRRNVHRIEKGLCMPNRRRVFALDFIPETITIYRKVIARQHLNPSQEVIWAYDVLSQYMEACGSQPEMVGYFEEFQSLPKPVRASHRMAHEDLPYWGDAIIKAPYRQNFVPSSDLTLRDLEGLVLKRRSVRWFKPLAVEREKIDAAVALAKTSPSACNRIPYRFVILDDSERVRHGANLAMGTAGYAEQIPALAVVVGDLSNYFHERDRHLIYIDASLAAMTLIYGLEVQNLSTCVINWSDVPQRERAMRKFLKLRRSERPIMLIAIGYADPDGTLPYSSKKENSMVRSYNA